MTELEQDELEGRQPGFGFTHESLSTAEAEAILQRLAQPAVGVPRVRSRTANDPTGREATSAEAWMGKAEVRYRTLIEQIPAVTFMAALDESLNELYVSPQIEKLLGFSQQEWLADPVLWYTQLHPDDRARWNDEFARTCATGEPFASEYRLLTRDGRVVWIHGEAQVMCNEAGQPVLLQGVAYDITARKEVEEVQRAHQDLERQVQERTSELAHANQTLQAEIVERKLAQESLLATLKEKDVLLKEIHHRVKNNLQVISSLLNLQSAAIQDPQTLLVFKESQHRVKSMALIHEKLYQAGDLAQVDFSQYVRDLVAYLFRSYAAPCATVTWRSEIRDVFLEPDTAIPCGLILNELVSNCLKHAFPPGTRGEIVVRLHAAADHLFILIVSDNGTGLPPALDFRNTDSLGLQLVNSLTHQLGGTIELVSGPGATFQITFPSTPERTETCKP